MLKNFRFIGLRVDRVQFRKFLAQGFRALELEGLRVYLLQGARDILRAFAGTGVLEGSSNLTWLRLGFLRLSCCYVGVSAAW